jgi:hypothetical protein
MIDLLAVTTGANLGPFAPVAQDGVYIIWLFALVGGVAGAGAIGHAGYSHVTNGANWGRTFGEVLGGAMGLGFAALCVTAANTLGGAITF